MNLPEGWAISEIGDIGEIVTGKTPSTKVAENFGGNIPFIKPGDLDHGGYIHSTIDTLTELGLKSVPKVPSNSIAVTCIGNLGKIGITTTESATNQQINSVVPSQYLNYKFIYHYLATLKPWLEQEASATTVTIINKGKFSKAPIKVAPFAEQQQIAIKLDELLAQIDSIKTRLDAIPKIIKRFRQSVLAAAVSGKLTEDWRINLDDSAPWSYGIWADILRPGKDSFKRGPFGSALKKDMFIDKGYKIYEQYCPINDDCSYARYYISSEKFEEMRTFEVLDFDFLISCSGVSLGRITQVPKNSEKGIINQALLRVRLDSSKYDDNFFKILFKSPSFQKALFDNSTGSAIPNLKGVKELKAMVVPLPKVQEQTEIARRVEQLFAYADQIEQRVKDAQARVNHLTQAILAKAFRCELTADWRAKNPELICGENSAEALLAKIQASRTAKNLQTKTEGLSMMPKPVRLFHITAIDNLETICRRGALVSKNAGASLGINYQHIAHSGAQSSRTLRTVPNPPGGGIHDFVPFYFAPRSPMLFAVNSGNVDGCDLRQADILHFETTVEAVTTKTNDFDFYDRNATLRYSEAFTDLALLSSKIAWNLITEQPRLDGYCQYFFNNFNNEKYFDSVTSRAIQVVLIQPI